MTKSAAAMKLRTKEFAIRVIKLVRSLPRDFAAQTIGNQVLRSATSVGANYRAASRGRSPAEFRAKIGVVLEESDETAYWIELIRDAEILPAKRLSALLQEANEITAMMVASLNTSKKNSP